MNTIETLTLKESRGSGNRKIELAHRIFTRNSYDYKLEIVERTTYDNDRVYDKTILVFGHNFTSEKIAQEFTNTKAYQDIFKAARLMAYPYSV